MESSVHPSVDFFLGATTPAGFKGYFAPLRREPGMQLVLLKSGPGCGKSTMMKRLARAAQDKGEPIQRIHCASDPDSLDGVVFLRQKRAIIDATAPHVVEPEAPGADERVLSLYHTIDADALHPHKDEVTALFARNQLLRSRAARYVASAGSLLLDSRRAEACSANFEKVRRYVKRLRAAGVEIYPFFRVKFPPFGSRINWRNHRKVCVIDGHSGFIGGMNIADRYMTGGKFDRWRDTHLRVMGPAVASLQYSFAIDWNFMGQPLVDEPAGTERYAPAGRGVGLQLVTSGPTSRWSNLAFMMLKAIGNAKKRVYLQTPYFLPTDALLRTLQAAALARVDVRVMMPGRSDSTILTLASRSYIQECLRAGIKIYFYEAGMLHAKTLVVDDDFASVGSTNFDFRSFEHNFEANFFIYDREINSRLTADFEADMALSRRIRASEWRHRPVLVKAKESIYRLLSPIL